ncbi:hypothetical protein BVX93_01665 [bacterium B13(2017)]|nr:hypothetical protein BVX93_01665 [bacterium B13(2017)]
MPLVTIASRKEEKVIDAPGIIKVFSGFEIRSLGYNTLVDIADITAGFGVEEEYGLKGFEVRGLSSGGYANNTVLLMIDGVPINLARNYRAEIEEELPLQFIESVEILKGPSSALYGTGAYLGIINIVTHQSINSEVSHLKLSLGSPDLIKRVIAKTQIEKQDFHFNLLAGIYKKSASKELFLDQTSSQNNPIYSNIYDNVDSYSLISSIKFINKDSFLYGLEPGIIYFKRAGGLRTGWMGFTRKADELIHEVWQPYVKYYRDLTDNLSLDAMFFYQYQTEAATFGFVHEGVDTDGGISQARYKFPNEIYQTDLHFNYEINKSFNIICGFTHDTRWENDSSDAYSSYSGKGIHEDPPPKKTKVTTNSYYIQAKKSLSILKDLNITAGLRYEDGETFEKTSPRLGFVQKITDHFNIKLLFGRAIKAPSFSEIRLNEVDYIDLDIPDLKPESIDTYEASLIYFKQKFHINLTYFTIKATDTISRVPFYDSSTGNTLSIYGNLSSGVSTNGLEFNIESIIPNGKLFANATYQKAEDDNGNEITNMPKLKYNLGIIYFFSNPIDLNFSLVLKYSEYNDRGNITNDYILSQKGNNIGDRTIIDLNLSKQISQNTSLEVTIHNLFDKKYSLPTPDWFIYDNPQSDRKILFSLQIDLL